MKVRLPLSLLFACAASVAAGMTAPAASAASASLTTPVTPSLVYTDPLISKQWQWNPDKGGVNIAPVWNDGIIGVNRLTGEGIVIGIIDQWVEPNHEDLNVSPYNPGTNLANGLSKDFVGSETIPTDDPETDEDESATQIYTDEEHGTFVAGMAAAVGGNDLGVVGAAPGATIAGLHTDLTYDTTMSAFWWGTGVSSSGGYSGEAAIQVKNCSWGSSFNESGVADYWDAIEKTSRNNVIYVFAAGNARGGDYTEPGSTGWSSEGNSPYIINVAATNTDGTYSSFSSYGSNVFISAPGAGVVSTDRTGTYGYNSGSISSSSDETTSATGSIADADYASSDGTSFSSPLVAGVIALGKQVCMPMDVRWAKHALAYSSGHGTAPNIDAKYDSDKGTYVQESGYTTTTTDEDGNTTTVTVSSTGEWHKNNGGYWFNNNYGFGLVDPEEFIDTVQDIAYTTVETTYSTTSISKTISSEASGTERSAEYSVSTSSSSAASGLNQDIETVSVTLNFSEEFLNNEDFDLDSLKVTLISPDGLESVLVQPSWDVAVSSSILADSDDATSASWTFLSNAYWGASYAGTDGDWTVKIEYDGVEDVDMSGWITVSSVDFTMGEMVFEGSTRGVDAGTTVNAHALVLDSSGFAVNGKFYVEDAVYVQGGTFTIGSGGEVGVYANAELNKGAIYVQSGGTATIEGTASFSRGVHLYGGTFNLRSNSLASGSGFYVYGGTLNVRAGESNSYVSAGGTVTVTGGSVYLRSGVNFQSSVVLNGGSLTAESSSSGTSLSIYGANASATLGTKTTFNGGISVGRTETRTTTTTDEETGETSTSTETILYGGTLTLLGRVTTPTLSLAGEGSATLSSSGNDQALLSGSVSVTDSATFSIDGTQRDSDGEVVGAEITGLLSLTGGNVSWTGTLTTGGVSVSGGGTLESRAGSTLGVVSSARTATYDSETQQITVNARNTALSVENAGIFRVNGITTVASGEVVISDGATLSFSSGSQLVIGGNTGSASYTGIGEDGTPVPKQTDEKYYLAGLTFDSTGSEQMTVNVNYDYGTALPYSATLIKFEQDVSEKAGVNAAGGDVSKVNFNVTVPNAPQILTVTDTGYETELLDFTVTKDGETGELVLGVSEEQAGSTEFITGRLYYDWQPEEVTAVQVALLRNEAASADLLAALEDFTNILEVHALYNGIGTPVNVIAIDELHDKQANAVTGALSRRSRELRSGFIHSDTWSNPLFGTSGFSFAARPNMVAATGFVPYVTAEEDYPLMIWMNGGYSFSEADDGAMTVSTKTNMLNFMMGADYGVSENLAVGLFAGYTSGRTKFDDSSRTEAQSRNIGVYLAGSASDSAGSIYFTAMASYGYEEYDFKRRVSVLGVNASADASPDGWQGIVFLEGGYEWKMKNFTMGPSFSLRYVANNLDGYTESSSSAWMRQEVEDVSYDSLQSSVGWRMAYRADFETVSLLPEVRLSWNHEFLGRDEDFDTRLALPNSDSYTNSIVNTGDDYATAGVGLTVMLGEVSTLSLDYDIQFLRDDADPTHSINAMLRVRF